MKRKILFSMEVSILHDTVEIRGTKTDAIPQSVVFVNKMLSEKEQANIQLTIENISTFMFDTLRNYIASINDFTKSKKKGVKVK